MAALNDSITHPKKLVLPDGGGMKDSARGMKKRAKGCAGRRFQNDAERDGKHPRERRQGGGERQDKTNTGQIHGKAIGLWGAVPPAYGFCDIRHCKGSGLPGRGCGIYRRLIASTILAPLPPFIS